MQNRRDFLKTAGALAAGAALAGPFTGCARKAPNVNRLTGKMRLSFEPYELQLRHTFTVASYSRKTTPDVQVRIDFEGYTGYGEASMPPYLGQSVESVTAFLQKVDLSGFNDPAQMEEILTYVDSLSEGDSAAKAAVDIALHDLVGKLWGSASTRRRWSAKRRGNAPTNSTFSKSRSAWTTTGR